MHYITTYFLQRRPERETDDQDVGDQEREDEQPQVVVLKEGDLSQEDLDAEKKRVLESEESKILTKFNEVE